MDNFLFYLEKIKISLTERGLFPAIFALSAAAFTLSVVSACVRSDCERTHASAIPFVYNILTAVACYFLCLATPADGILEKYRQDDVVSFSLIMAFICFFVLTALYALSLLVLTPKAKKNKQSESEEAVTFGVRRKRRGEISEITLPVYPVETRKLGRTEKTDKINFAALREILAQISSECPISVKREIEEMNEKIFPYENVKDAFVEEFESVLPKILKIWAKYGNDTVVG